MTRKSLHTFCYSYAILAVLHVWVGLYVMPANTLRHQTKAVIKQWASFSVKVPPVPLAAERSPSGKVSHFMLRSSAEGGPVAEENLPQQLRFQQVSESREGAKADGKENQIAPAESHSQRSRALASAGASGYYCSTNK